MTQLYIRMELKDLLQTMSFKERLIYLVREREPLWNLKLPLEIRSKDNKERLWKEVHRLLASKHSITDLKKKWKNLVDTHRRLIQNERDVNGTSTRKKKSWSHYNSMLFMREMIEEKEVKWVPNESKMLILNENSLDISHQREDANTQMICINGEDVELEHDAEHETESSSRNHDPISIIKIPETQKVLQSSEAAFGFFIECSLREIKDPCDRLEVQRALMNTLTTELRKLAEKSHTSND